jgi:CRISPR/Cas system-associated endonuclease Cas1
MHTNASKIVIEKDAKRLKYVCLSNINLITIKPTITITTECLFL